MVSSCKQLAIEEIFCTKLTCGWLLAGVDCLFFLFFDREWLRTMHLTPLPSGGPYTGSTMVTRVIVRGEVCLGPKVQLSWEPVSDDHPVDSLFPKSKLGSDL